MNENPPTDSETPALQLGLDQFNRGEYYACHDTLEAIWMQALSAEKPFYQGILQISVALYHLGNHNWQGAVILLGEGLNRLVPFEPTYQDVDVTALVDCGHAWLSALQTLGPDRVTFVAAALSQVEAQDRHASTVITLPELEINLPLPWVLTP